MTAAAPTRPVLRYHGGKWKLAPWILTHFPAHRVYTEAFGGAASMLLRKPRVHSEVYNDLDGEVVGLFRVLRDPAQSAELASLLRLTPFARAEFVDSYEAHPDPVEQARRTVVRSFCGFGSDSASGKASGFRAGGRSQSAHPAKDWTNYPGALPAYLARLAGVVIECRPAVEILRQHDAPDALHYVDPPYVHGTRQSTEPNRGYRHEMTDADHRALAEVLRDLRGMVVLSGYPFALYDELFDGWHRVERAALADGARARTEVLWLNPACVAALGQRDLFAEPAC